MNQEKWIQKTGYDSFEVVTQMIKISDQCRKLKTRKARERKNIEHEILVELIAQIFCW